MNTLHYPSLELTRKLPKEICNSGFGYAECQWILNKRESVFISKEEFYSIKKSKGNEFIDLDWIFMECPSVMEMLDVIPEWIEGGTESWHINIWISTDKGEWIVKYIGGKTSLHMCKGNIPNALAKTILWLHENKYLFFNQ